MAKRRYFNVIEVLTEYDEVETRNKCEAQITSFHFPLKYPVWGWYRDKRGVRHEACWDIFGKLYHASMPRGGDLFMKGKFYITNKEWKEQKNGNEEV